MDIKTKVDAYTMATYNRVPLILIEGKGCYLTDEQGKEYLDFCAGIATNTLGYQHPKLTRALQKQMAKVMHLSNYYYSQPLAEASELLVAYTPFDRVFFCNSGTEANEGAIKLARKYGKQKREEKIQIVSMYNAFHGRTYGALTATAQEKYQAPFGPMLQGFSYVPFNDTTALKAVMTDNVCAVILEVIQGEGGVVAINPDYLKEVKVLCEKYEALLIIDEVQTGVGRTGKLYAFEHYGIVPDVITSAKGLGAGVPIGAILCKEAVAVLEKGEHGTTFGGNPLATTAASIVLKELMQEGLLEHVQTMGDYLGEKLRELAKKCSNIEAIRGKGLMRGIVLKQQVGPLIEACNNKSLLVVGAGEHVMRLLPPLIVQKKEIDEAIAILEEVLKASNV